MCVCLRAHALMSVPNDSPLDISVWLSFQDRPLVLMYDTGVLIILYDTSAEEMVSQDWFRNAYPANQHLKLVLHALLIHLAPLAVKV